MTNLSQALLELNQEDFIWIIYSFIVLGALISNVLERDWVLKHQEKSYRSFLTINVSIFMISFLLYGYFVWVNLYHIFLCRSNITLKELFLNEANFVASCLFLIGGIIYIITELFSSSIETSPQELI